jgi:hypothetical protein
LDLIYQLIGGLTLAFVCWFIIRFAQEYPRCKREYDEAQQQQAVPKLIKIDKLSDETVGTLDGMPIWASIYTENVKYDFEGVMEPEIFSIIGATNQILIGNLIYKVSDHK